jgi:hypothetical protein
MYAIMRTRDGKKCLTGSPFGTYVRGTKYEVVEVKKKLNDKGEWRGKWILS